MEEEKKISITRRLEAGACGFIGSAFLVYGVTYFIPQEEYYVPRILMPLFDLFGNIGLAIGMVLLGAGMILYALNNWRKHGGGIGSYAGLIVLSLGLFIGLSFLSGDRQAETPASPEEQIEEIQNMERPQFSSQPANDFFDSFEQLLSDYQEHLAANDTQAISDDTTAFTLLMQTMTTVLEPMNKDEKYLFSQYNAKLQMAWTKATLMQPEQ